MSAEASRYSNLPLFPYRIQTHDSVQDMVVHSFLLFLATLHYVSDALPDVLPVLEGQTQHLYPLQNANLPPDRTITILSGGIHLCVYDNCLSELSDSGTE